MHILIATDGTDDVDSAVELVGRMYRPEDRVTTFMAVPVRLERPRPDRGVSGVEAVARVAEEAGPGPLGVASGARAAEQLAGGAGASRPTASPVRADEALAKRALERLGAKLAAGGIEADASWELVEGHVARAIIAAVKVKAADLLVVGSQRPRRGPGSLGSVASRLVNRAPVPVLVVR